MENEEDLTLSSGSESQGNVIDESLQSRDSIATTLFHSRIDPLTPLPRGVTLIPLTDASLRTPRLDLIRPRCHKEFDTFVGSIRLRQRLDDAEFDSGNPTRCYILDYDTHVTAIDFFDGNCCALALTIGDPDLITDSMSCDPGNVVGFIAFDTKTRSRL
jgi:hypothetical protein